MRRPIWGRLSLARPRVPRCILLSGAAILATAAACAWALYIARLRPGEHFPLPEADLGRLVVNPYGFGLALQLTVIPMALLYLFSSTSTFRRFMGGRPTPRERRTLLIALALLCLLVFGYGEGLSRLAHEPPHVGYIAVVPLAVVAAGLLGGWRMGLILGGLGLFLYGTREFTSFLEAFSPELISLWQQDGLRGLLGVEWGHDLLRIYLLSPWAPGVLWAGLFCGLAADILGQRRYQPLAALLLGALAGFGNGCFPILAGRGTLLDFLISATLASGLAMVVISLIVRGVQGEVAQRQAAAAELALTRAELRALRAQINPHFLFNALNTIRFFARTDPEAARRLLLHLSEVFQRALRSGESVTLRDELGYVEAYLALEKARLGERLRVEWSLCGEDCLRYTVPTLILQPLVENAVIHAIAKKPEGGTIQVAAKVVAGDLLLQVEDDGPGIDPGRLAEVLGSPEGDRPTVGLHNVDSRLRALYGDDHALVVVSEVGRGTRVEIRIPLEEETNARADRR